MFGQTLPNVFIFYFVLSFLAGWILCGWTPWTRDEPTEERTILKNNTKEMMLNIHTQAIIELHNKTIGTTV
jgi:hypothetical protein